MSRVSRFGLSAVLASAFVGVHLAALRAAGLNGTAPPHAAAIKQLMSTLTSNWEWLVATGLGLVLVLLGGLLAFGSIQAPGWFFKVLAGILVILVAAPAVLA